MFTSIDRLRYADPTSTLWGWPQQNPLRFADPRGRAGVLAAFGVAVDFVIPVAIVGTGLVVADVLFNDGHYTGIASDFLFGPGAATPSYTAPTTPTGVLLNESTEETDEDASSADEGDMSEEENQCPPKQRKGRRGRFKDLDEIQDQVESIQDAQQTFREQGKSSQIQSTTKSEQRFDNALRNIRNRGDIEDE